MAEGMKLQSEREIQKHIILQIKSKKRYYWKFVYTQISITQFSYNYSSKILQASIINKYNFLLNGKSRFNIVNISINKNKDGEEKEEEFEKFALSFYSIKKFWVG